MSLNLILLVIYDLLIVSYVAFLVQQAIAYKSKFGYLCEASGLGEVKNAQYRIYNLGYFLFGFLSFAFTYNLAQVLVPSALANVAVILVYVAGFSLCLIALFPRDTFHSIHTVVSTVMFFCATSSLLLLSYPFYQSPVIPKAIIPFNFLIISMLMYYLYLKIKYFRKFGKLDNNMEKFVSIWEWAPFLSTYAWFFIVNNILIFHIFK